MLKGVLYAWIAGLIWGLVFVAPVILHDYPAVALAIGRYLAFGLIALPLAWLARAALAQLSRADWIEALKLSLVGNLLYYAFVAAGIQLAGAPLPTMLIGTLPVVIAVVSNLQNRQLPWRQLAVSLVVILLGILLVNRDELEHLRASSHSGSLLYGAALTLVGVVCWTWYPIRNAAWLQRHPQTSSSTWATAQGITTLPLAAAGALIVFVFTHAGAPDLLGVTSTARVYEWPLGARPLVFVVSMLVLGLAASWLGTLLWNRASQLLPTALAGQLIVFETLSALLYAFIWRGQWPGVGTLLGIVLLVAGVIAGVRAFQQHGRSAPVAAMN